MVDNRGGLKTDKHESAAYLEKFGLKSAMYLPTPNDMVNYEQLYWTEKQLLEKYGPRAIATINMHALSSMRFLDDFMLYDKVFGKSIS